MSAWIVSKVHIDLIVKGIIEGTRDEILPPSPTPHVADQLGQQLMEECVASVTHRYPDDKPGELPGPVDAYYLKPYTYADPGYSPTAAELYKAIDCYVYQSCKHDGWKVSDAFSVCRDTQVAIAVGCAPCLRMREKDRRQNYDGRNPWPEHEAAPWGFDEETIEQLRAAVPA